MARGVDDHVVEHFKFEQLPGTNQVARDLDVRPRGCGIMLALYTREQVSSAFFDEGMGTKHELATLFAKRFSDELGARLPNKRKPWQSEHASMDIFDAVALALMPRKRTAWPKTRCS